MLGTLGRLCRDLGERTRALTYFQQALALQRARGDTGGEVATLRDLGGLCDDLGEKGKALGYFQQALQRELGKPGPPAPNWTDKASLSFVDVGGNAVSQSLGFSNQFIYNWTTASSLAFNAGAVRVSSRTTTYAATGSSPTSFTLATLETNAVTTADYQANVRYAQDLTERLLWFAGAGWERNLPAGIAGRTAGSAGLGYWWIRTDSRKFRTDLGAGYTHAAPVTRAPGFRVDYATWNAAASFEQKVGAASVLTSNLGGAAATGDARNFLVGWHNEFSTAVSRRLALKVGYVLSYNNRPASEAVPIIRTGSVPAALLGQTFVTLKKLDTQFTTSLVISF
jgi:putative salt-induced outer membrane protein YdiY